MSKHQKKRDRRPADTPDPRWLALGRKLVDLRRARGWHAYQVAQMIGVDPATISQIENARRPTGPEHETLVRLSGLYEIPIDDLLTPHVRTESVVRRDSRDRVDPGADPIQAAAIRAAVSDAIFAIVADLFEALTVARSRRATADAHGEAGGLVASASRRVNSH